MGQMDGPVAGLVKGRELQSDSDASKVEVEYWFGLVSSKMSLWGLFGLRMESSSTPSPTARLWKRPSSSSGTGKVTILQEKHDFHAGQCSITRVKVLHSVAARKGIK